MARNTALSIADCQGVLDVVHAEPGLSTKQIAKHFPYLTRPAVYKRLVVLRDAQLVRSEGAPRTTVKWFPDAPF